MKPEAVISAYAEEIDARTNTRLLTNEPDRMFYQIDGKDGSGTVEVLTLFPGVILQFHSFHCKSFRLAANGNVNEGLKINFCTEGRMEVRMSDNLCLFMEPGNLSLDVRTVQDSFQFPCGHYHGVELFLHQSSIGKVFPEVWEELKINPMKIQDRFCGEGKSYVIFADERFKQIFENMLCMSSLIALFAAPVYMMLLAKAPVHGPIFIAAILSCLFLLLQGNIWIVILTGIVAGILAEVIAGMGKFRNPKLNVLSYVFFSENLLGGFLPIWVMRDYYFADTLERGMSADFCNTLEALTPIWVLLLMIAGTVIFSLIGCAVSKKLFRKHFEKAGMV